MRDRLASASSAFLAFRATSRAASFAIKASCLAAATAARVSGRGLAFVSTLVFVQEERL
jgi:hypothetical protein